MQPTPLNKRNTKKIVSEIRNTGVDYPILTAHLLNDISSTPDFVDEITKNAPYSIGVKLTNINSTCKKYFPLENNTTQTFAAQRKEEANVLKAKALEGDPEALAYSLLSLHSNSYDNSIKEDVKNNIVKPNLHLNGLHFIALTNLLKRVAMASFHAASLGEHFLYTHRLQITALIINIIADCSWEGKIAAAVLKHIMPILDVYGQELHNHLSVHVKTFLNNHMQQHQTTEATPHTRKWFQRRHHPAGTHTHHHLGLHHIPHDTNIEQSPPPINPLSADQNIEKSDDNEAPQTGSTPSTGAKFNWKLWADRASCILSIGVGAYWIKFNTNLGVIVGVTNISSGIYSLGKAYPKHLALNLLNIYSAIMLPLYANEKYISTPLSACTVVLSLLSLYNEASEQKEGRIL